MNETTDHLDAPQATCVIAGGGPAGMVLGLLLARAGIAVTVMEKHADFLRDFRGDTVHRSTRRLMSDLGLSEQLEPFLHPLDTVDGVRTGRPFVGVVPQWDFLETLADAAAREPSFRLLRGTEVVGPIRDRGAVTGVRYRGPDGAIREMPAALTVACDGRWSALRSALDLRLRTFDVPMDVWWFRLPRCPDDPAELSGVSHIGHRCAMVDRGDYYQIGYLIPKGRDAELRARGIEALRRDVAELVPALAGRVAELESLDDVKLLDVRLNRLRRWFSDGILFIGDAAHAMSPAGGIGVNLAIADAVAAARIIAGPLREGTLSTRHLARVQVRRALPTVLTQTVQQLMHRRLRELLAAPAADAAPRPGRLMSRIGRSALPRKLAGFVLTGGPFSERTPDFARRPAASRTPAADQSTDPPVAAW
ncbi:FAD-dependent oxidoreductase [Mycolicibacterium thermoresistibile]|nr:FAD-dependent oxidoreductase [Mycolicibacterium thermoresistibile]